MMNGHLEPATVRLVVLHGIANLAIGVSLLLWSNLSAESVLSRFLPSWLWPCMFIAAGLCAFVGLSSRFMARFAFVFAAIVTSVFGFASLWAVIQGVFAAIPTTVFLLYIAALKVYVSWVIQQRDHIIEAVTEATMKGQTALDRVTDGSDS